MIIQGPIQKSCMGRPDFLRNTQELKGVYTDCFEENLGGKIKEQGNKII